MAHKDNMKVPDLLTEKRLRQLDEMVTEISPDALQAKLDRGELFHLVDVDDWEDYRRKHIPGAINLPLGALRQHAPERFRPFQQIVVYAHQGVSTLAAVAAHLLYDLGFFNVEALAGGLEAWEQAGFEVEGDAELEAPEAAA